MKKREVFDPAMCGSTGVCGVDVAPARVQFAADLQWLSEQGNLAPVGIDALKQLTAKR